MNKSKNNKQHSKRETLNRLYRILHHYDKQIINSFEDFDNVSDKEYFENAILGDFVINSLTIITNLLEGNKNSVAVDEASRGLIEYFLLDAANSSNDIEKENYHIFRYNYLTVEDDNLKKILKHFGKKSCFEDKNETYNFVEYLCSYFKCSKAEIKSAFVSDPLFFLKKNLDDKVRPSALIDKYFSEMPVISKIYSFFSLVSHPHFFGDKKTSECTSIKRDEYIDIIINLIEVQVAKLGWKLSKEFKSYHQEVKENELVKKFDLAYGKIYALFNRFIREITSPDDGITIDYNTYFFTFVRDMLSSMNISYTISHYEQTISQFKTFIENAAVFYYISHYEKEKWNILLYSLSISSANQFNRIISDNTNEDANKKIFKQFFDDIYDHYLEIFGNELFANKNDESIISKNEFADKAYKNILYVLKPGKITYIYFVQEMFNSIYSKEKEKFHLDLSMMAYKFGLDLEHSSGYKINISTELWKALPHLCLAIAYQFLFATFSFRQSENGNQLSKFSFSISQTEYEQFFQLSNDSKDCFD